MEDRAQHGPAEKQVLRPLNVWQSAALQYANIKAWMLALAVAASYTAGAPALLPRMLLVCTVFALLGFVSNGVYGVLGAALGFTLTALLTFALSRHGIRFTPPNATMPLDVFPFLTAQYTALALATAIGGAVLFALYPAWRASRLRPVEALSGH